MKNHEQWNNLGGGEVEPGIGLAPDYLNAWMALGYALNIPPAQWPKGLKQGLQTPIRSYEAYIREKNKESGERIIRESDPEKVKQINALVDEFNAAKDELLAHGDIAAIRTFWEKAELLVRGGRGTALQD